MANEREITVQTQDTSVEAMISQALAKGTPIDVMERLFVMRNEELARRAKAAFVRSLASFQSECPIIKKNKIVKNKDGTVRYSYASMDGVQEQIKKPLGDNELSYTWDVAHKQDHMEVICKLTHSLGHSETSTMEIPISKSEYMTTPQSYATAMTYAKRYTLLNALGIGTADEDTDSRDTKKQPDPKHDKSKIIFLLRNLGHNTETKEEIGEGVLEFAKLKLEDKNFPAIIKKLEALVIEKSHANN